MSLIEVGPGQVELVVRGPGAPAASVRLFDWSRVDEYETVFAVEAVADGVCARLENVTVTVWDDMSGFFDGLARDFRGWEEERVWTSNHLVGMTALAADLREFLRRGQGFARRVNRLLGSADHPRVWNNGIGQPATAFSEAVVL